MNSTEAERKREFLQRATVPARLTAEETAWYLGFLPHEIPILVRAGLLKPLGHPPPNGTKYFALATIESLRTDTKWLAKASDAITQHWKVKNSHTHQELAFSSTDAS